MFLIDFLFHVPLWLTALILVGFFMGFAVLVMWLMRRLVLPHLNLQHDDIFYTNNMVQFAMLLYGLVAAMTAVSVWQRYAQVSEIVSAEATAIVSVWRDVGGYPSPLRETARDILRGYTIQVIEEAWPQQRQGKTPNEGVVWMDQLQEQIFSFEPKTDNQRIIHAEVLRSYNHLLQQRRMRVDSARTGLPGVFWLMLIPGALCCIALCMLYRVDNVRLQGILMLGVSVSLGMVVFIIVALDRPFIGDMGIGPDSYQLVYDQHMKPPNR